ncbi:hypothetical protein TcCL_NonESM04373 [Trypanosoma cruzi]|nr:hypothetical protein TcCL_NonESM04373 [Trypanosoma cruzi]
MLDCLTAAPGPAPRIVGRIQEPAMFPSRDRCWRRADGIYKRPDHLRRAKANCSTLRSEGTCCRSAGITIYLGKHEGGQERRNCACCSKSALILFYFFGTGN